MTAPPQTDVTLIIPASRRRHLSWILGTEALACLAQAAALEEPTTDEGRTAFEGTSAALFASWFWLCRTHDLLDARPVLGFRAAWSEADWRTVFDGLAAFARAQRQGAVPAV